MPLPAELLNQLADALARIYPDHASVRTMATTAGVPVERIPVDDKPLGYWVNLLQEAENRGLTQSLLDRAAADYPVEPRLAAARQAYTAWALPPLPPCDLSVLGVLCDLAHEATPNPAFQRIMAGCTPHDRLEPFFSSVARSPLATRLARENALDVFLRWNYWCAEVRYLSASATPAQPPARWGGRRLPGPGKRLGRPSKARPGRRRLLALWCTEQEWDLLLQQLPEDTRERYHELAAVAAARTPRIANGADTP